LKGFLGGRKQKKQMAMTSQVSNQSQRNRKKEMNKEDRKKYNSALTYHYLREQDNGEELAADMEKKAGESTRQGN
jgi:hypothetical protein